MKNDQLSLFTGNKGNENHNEQHIMFPADFAEFSRFLVFIRQLFFVARNCFRDESERIPPIFPEILHRARSHNHPCRFFSKLMFRRHELREFGRKQRVTDAASVITPFR